MNGCLCFITFNVSPGLMYIFVVDSPEFGFIFSVLAKRLAGKSISKIICFVLSGT